MDAWYRERAVAVLGGAQRLSPTVLTELGRFEDDGKLREAAENLAEESPPTARAAVRLLRAWRLGRDPKPERPAEPAPQPRIPVIADDLCDRTLTPIA